MRRRYEGMRMSAMIVQSVYRGHQYRTTQATFDVTVRIQAWRRMTFAVYSYRSVRVCTIVLQAVYRGFTGPQYFKRLRLTSC
jgi:hypothetical protein